MENNDLNLSLGSTEGIEKVYTSTEILVSAASTALHNYSTKYNEVSSSRKLRFTLEPYSVKIDEENDGKLVGKGCLRLTLFVTHCLIKDSNGSPKIEKRVIWQRGVGFTHASQVMQKDWAESLLIDLLSDLVGSMHILIDAGKPPINTFTDYVKSSNRKSNIIQSSKL